MTDDPNQLPKDRTCFNCGKKGGPKTYFQDKWFCPGACDVTRGKKP